jgi:hypothetical protein
VDELLRVDPAQRPPIERVAAAALLGRNQAVGLEGPVEEEEIGEVEEEDMDEGGEEDGEMAMMGEGHVGDGDEAGEVEEEEEDVDDEDDEEDEDEGLEGRSYYMRDMEDSLLELSGSVEGRGAQATPTHGLAMDQDDDDDDDDDDEEDEEEEEEGAGGQVVQHGQHPARGLLGSKSMPALLPLHPAPDSPTPGPTKVQPQLLHLQPLGSTAQAPAALPLIPAKPASSLMEVSHSGIYMPK